MSQSRLKWVFVLLSLFGAVVLALVVWWGSLLLDQAARLDEADTIRMIQWELAGFLILVSAGIGAFYWVYVRELRRTYQLQSFFASITHELRTPLTGIRLQAEAFAAKKGMDSSSAELIRRLLEDTSRLESQVERSLELARVEGGGEIFLRPLELSGWLDRWIGNQSERRPLLKIEKNLSQEFWVDADPTALQQVMQNLLDNSISHSRSAEVVVGMDSPELGVLRYRDNGSGAEESFSQEKWGKLFSKGRQSRGAGVGLYLIRELMEKMGGKAEFRGGKGFETWLRFSRAQAEE